MDISNKKNKIEKVSAQKKKMFDEKRGEIDGLLEKLDQKEKKKVSGSIIAPENKGTILRITDAGLSVAEKMISENINVTIESGERIARYWK
jgi:hypothetical protein